MKLTIYSADKKEAGSIDLPSQFKEGIREDLIRRAFKAYASNNRQPYGSDRKAGMKASAEISRRRHDYKGSYGFGISRVPRKIMSHRGTRFNWVGAVAPGTVGGRRAHPPKVDKDYSQKINKLEKRKAIRSAISATVDIKIVKGRGHVAPENYPFAISSDFEKIQRTSDLKKALIALGFEDEIKRSSVRKIRAGKGTMRGRKYQGKKGPLFVVADNKSQLIKTAANIPGADVAVVSQLNINDLAPGGDMGRITLWTQEAIEKIKNKKLFTKEIVHDEKQ